MSNVSVVMTLLDSSNVRVALDWFKKTWPNNVVEMCWNSECICKVCKQLGGLYVDDAQVSNKHCYGCIIMVTIYGLPGKLEKTIDLVDQYISKSELKFVSVFICRELLTISATHGNLLKKNITVEIKDV